MNAGRTVRTAGSWGAVSGVRTSGPLAVWIKGPLCDSSVTGVELLAGGRKCDVKASLERVAFDPVRGASPSTNESDLKDK